MVVSMERPKLMDLHGKSQSDNFLTRLLYFVEGLSTIQFFLMLLVFFLYLMGSFQEFSDESNMLLLNMASIMGYSAAIVNFFSLLVIVLWSLRHRIWMVGRMIFSVSSLVLGLGISFIVAVLHGFINPSGF